MQILTCSRDNKLKLLDARTLQVSFCLKLYRSRLPSLQPFKNTNPDLMPDLMTPDPSPPLAPISTPSSTLVTIPTKAISTLSHESFRVAQNWSRATFSPDGQYVVAGSATGTVHVWETITGRCRQNLTQHQVSAKKKGVNFSCHKLLRDDRSDCPALPQPPYHQTAVSSCAWAPGTGGWQQVASCDKNGYINMWD